MSAGSNNIVITITDGVAATIEPKIRGIGQAAKDAQTYIQQLQAALNGTTISANNLGNALPRIPAGLNQVGQSSNRVTGALAQLVARVAGAEAGLGMLGGAFGRVGVAAGVAAPLIEAGLAIAAIGAAVLIYNHFEEASRKLTLTQIQVNEQFGAMRTRLLEQKEEFIGLTEGPMAKYAAQLKDLPLKEITSNIANITKELKEQASTLATVGSLFERYGAGGSNVTGGSVGQVRGGAAPFSIKQASDFINQSESSRSGAVNQLKGLQDALSATGYKLTELHNLEKTQGEETQSITEVSRKSIQRYYTQLLGDLAEYLQKQKTLRAGAAGEFLAEQRKQSEQELKQFNEDLSNLKSSANGVVSPQQVLALRQQQLSSFDTKHPGDTNQASPFAGTRDALVKDIGAAQQAIERQNRSLQELFEKYEQTGQASAAYSQQLRIEVEQRKAAAEVERIGPDNTNKAATIAALNDVIAAKVRDAEVNKEQIAIYNQFNDPILKYNAGVEASNRLLRDGAITTTQAAIAKAALARSTADALNPLNSYVIGLQHEVSLFGIYGTTLQAATEVDRVRQNLQQHGRDLTGQETTQLTLFLTQLERQRQLQGEINNLYLQNAGTIEKLLINQQALNVAKEKGVVSETQYKVATANLNVQLADQALLYSKNATLQNQIVAGIGRYIQDYQGLAKGLSDAYGNAFKTIADGAANSLGRAIAYGENLSDAFKNVAREVVSNLLSAFIKLGIQWLITEAIGKSIASTALAAAIAEAEAVSAAWAPAAAFASLATLGANAAPAAAAVSGTVALSEALSVVGSAFRDGGFVVGKGSGTSDDILARLSNGEFVVNAQATAQNRQLLEQINQGTSSVRSNPISSSGGTANRLNIQVIHDGSTAISVRQLSDGQVRIIAKQEARAAIQEHGPAIIAADLQNPNGRSSKALRQNYSVDRRR